VALGIFFTRRRNAKAAAAAPSGPTSTGSEARADRPGRRTKSTPKPRR